MQSGAVIANLQVLRLDKMENNLLLLFGQRETNLKYSSTGTNKPKLPLRRIPNYG